MKKVCILQNDFAYGGTDTFVLNLCKGLMADGYDVTVILSIDKNAVAVREHELIQTGVKIIKTCYLHGLRGRLKHFYLLYNVLREGKYDVFQTNIDLFNGPQLFIAWLAGVPIRECHSHNSQQGKELSEGRTCQVRVYQWLMRWLCWTFSNRRGGCSLAALDFLFGSKWKNNKHTRVVHNGIDLELYSNRNSKLEGKHQLGLKNRFNICTVGRMDFQKNSEFLLDCFYELSNIRVDVDLVWCGKGHLENLLKERVHDYKIADRVHLLGTRNDIPIIMQACDLFFLPSRFEGLGIVLIEAQAAGLTCLMSDVVPEEVNCGLCQTASLNKDARYWALQLSELIDGNIKLQIDKDKLNEYSVSNMVKEMEELFE